MDSDIDLSEHYWRPIGSYSTNDTVAFICMFNGNDFTISGLTIDIANDNNSRSKSYRNYGLFGMLKDANVVNVLLVRPNIQITDTLLSGNIDMRVGGIAARAWNNTIIKNCYITNANFVVNTPRCATTDCAGILAQYSGGGDHTYIYKFPILKFFRKLVLLLFIFFMYVIVVYFHYNIKIYKK